MFSLWSLARYYKEGSWWQWVSCDQATTGDDSRLRRLNTGCIELQTVWINDSAIITSSQNLLVFNKYNYQSKPRHSYEWQHYINFVLISNFRVDILQPGLHKAISSCACTLQLHWSFGSIRNIQVVISRTLSQIISLLIASVHCLVITIAHLH
jgi:hypothetical protein